MAICKIEALYKYFPVASGVASLFRTNTQCIKAIDGVSLNIERGEIIGLAGESGSGKTTLGEILVGLQKPNKGRIVFEDTDVETLKGRKLKAFRRRVQMIFQDPYSTLNPRFTIGSTVAEPLIIHKIGSAEERPQLVIKALERAELRPAKEFIDRYPHELSGGQRQRVAISRAVVLEPNLLVTDEPVSMLDVSIRAGILNLIKKLRDELKISVLYISHDLSTISSICDRISIMYLGKIIEVGRAKDVIQGPFHPYTKALMSAVPVPDPFKKRERRELKGELPDQINLPLGCRFSPRCPDAFSACIESEPEMRLIKEAHTVACHLRY
jgi:peptide/nickel transport system ATP-binding protein